MINSENEIALELSNVNHDQVALTISAAFSPIIKTTALVCAAGKSGTGIKQFVLEFFVCLSVFFLH